MQSMAVGASARCLQRASEAWSVERVPAIEPAPAINLRTSLPARGPGEGQGAVSDRGLCLTFGVAVAVVHSVCDAMWRSLTSWA